MESENPAHPVEWDHKKVARFWDLMNTLPNTREEYFSRQVGVGVVNCIDSIADLRGDVLDYGCGPGYLCQELVRRSVNSVTGLDFSPDSIAEADQRCAGSSRWKGGLVATGNYGELLGNQYDFIFFIETIEHLLDSDIPAVLSHLRSLLRRDTGLLVVSTPHDEDLSRAQVCCPDCAAVFHRWQHQRKFSLASLPALMEQYGFETLLSATTDFARFNHGIKIPKNEIGNYFHGPTPHLFWIGRSN